MKHINRLDLFAHLEWVGLTEPTITMIYIDTWPEMILDIRMSNPWPTPDETSSLKVSGRPRACPIYKPLNTSLK